jgi:elongator complex protein 3
MNRARDRAWRSARDVPFDLEGHNDVLVAVLEEIEAAADLPQRQLSRILRRHPLPDGTLLSKSELLQGYAQLCERDEMTPDPELVRRLRVKPTRTISGVAPVTVLTKPFPCPGECIFCPDVLAMPKSYLPDEPGAMRAASHEFDPYEQTASRVEAMSRLGHTVDKVELLILGGTWSAYPKDYQDWFVRRCLDALNRQDSESLQQAQRTNETAARRNVGLVVETRPDQITAAEVRDLRRLGVTKVQLGIQSLDDEILALNRRGHTVADTRRAIRLLRLAGFKILVHWMPNLLGATPESDLEDFRRIWVDPALRPDELKIYPTSLLPHTELHEIHKRGEYEPYSQETLVALLVECKKLIPEYCRLNRLMRDIPAPNIVAGVTRSNLRQIVQQRMASSGQQCRCIRCREVRGQPVDAEAVVLESIRYETDGTSEHFLAANTGDGLLAAFLRLSLPCEDPPVAELEGCAVIRELHVYGPALPLAVRAEGPPQHAGLGTRLMAKARQIARGKGYERIAVIAAVGTRRYYARAGFTQQGTYVVGPTDWSAPSTG